MSDLICLHIKGNPFHGLQHYNVYSYLGQSPLGDAGAWGTQFKNDSLNEAARLWRMKTDSNALELLLPGVDLSGSNRDARCEVLEELMAKSAQFGMHMLIEWLINHPDQAVRLLAIRIISDANQGPAFEGVR